MNAGGQQVLNIVNGVTQQTEANRELGKEVSEGVIALGANGGVAYNDPKDLQKALSTADQNLMKQEFERSVVASVTDFFQAFSKDPSKFLPSYLLNTYKPLNHMIDPDNHTPEE